MKYKALKERLLYASLMPEHFHENNNYHHHVTNTLNISQNYTYFFNVHALKQTQVSAPSSVEKNMEKVEKNRKNISCKILTGSQISFS